MKRLVICADGTWNTRDQQTDEKTGHRCPTNVTKVARGVRGRDDQGVDQIVFYHDGLGTGGPLDKVTGGAFGAGIEANVRVLYRSIAYNWEPNDEIYMFGFSRGAFTVRTLAGFMNMLGLVQKDDDYYVPELYRCYETSKGPGTPEWEKAFHNIKNHRLCPPITFLGVWDTVGSLGAPGLLGLLNRGKYQYHQVGLNNTIQHAYHAMAIDERRKLFAPTLWERPANWTGTLEQAWFAGVHCNVGGSEVPDGVANEALHWMVEKAEKLGLAFDNAHLAHYTPCYNTKLANSFTAKYWALGQHLRPIGTHAAHGEMLHQSVLDRLKQADEKYEAKNVLAYQAAGGNLPITNTTRIERGKTPCPPLKPR